jgi:hypothetical protein
MPYNGGQILIATLNIQTRWRERKISKQYLSVYPLDMSDPNSKEYKLYLEYKGLVAPSEKTVEAFNRANVELPTILRKQKSSVNLLYDFMSSIYGENAGDDN